MATRSNTVERFLLLSEDKDVLNKKISSLSDKEHQAVLDLISTLENVSVAQTGKTTENNKNSGNIISTPTPFSVNYQADPNVSRTKKYSFDSSPAPFLRNVSPKGYQSVAFKPGGSSPSRKDDTVPPPLETLHSVTETPPQQQQTEEFPSPPPLGPISPPGQSTVFPPPPDPPASPDLPNVYPPPLVEVGVELSRPPPPAVDDAPDITVNISGSDFQKLFPKKQAQELASDSKDSYVTVGGKRYSPDSFKCATLACGKSLADSGYIEDNGRLLCPDCYEKFVTKGVCGKCNKPCTGDVLLAIGKQFHPGCFTCHKCGQRFEDKTFHMENGEPYCEKDWLEYFASKCHACKKQIGSGMQWFVVQNKDFHAECFRCAVCNRTLENQQFFMKQERLLCYAHASGH